MITPLVTPKPYPGCDSCLYLLRVWVDVTEPASPEYSRLVANKMAEKINEHSDGDHHGSEHRNPGMHKLLRGDDAHDRN